VGDNCSAPLRVGESWWALRDDVGKNWTLRVSGRPYQTDERDVNGLHELPGWDGRPPAFDPACENVTSLQELKLCIQQRDSHSHTVLGAIAKLLKATISFVVSVCLHVCLSAWNN
jgi:hypothetical protein